MCYIFQCSVVTVSGRRNAARRLRVAKKRWWPQVRQQVRLVYSYWKTAGILETAVHRWVGRRITDHGMLFVWWGHSLQPQFWICIRIQKIPSKEGPRGTHDPRLMGPPKTTPPRFSWPIFIYFFAQRSETIFCRWHVWRLNALHYECNMSYLNTLLFHLIIVT